MFGGYRDPQENILSQGLDDTFFNDAVDFVTPYNLPVTSPAAPKKDLISQIDAAKDDDEPVVSDQLLDCNKVWCVPPMLDCMLGSLAYTGHREKISNCPKAQNGDFDLEGLCADLQKKAKCDGSGPVVSEADFQYALQKYLCKDELAAARIAAAAKQTQTQAKAKAKAQAQA